MQSGYLESRAELDGKIGVVVGGGGGLGRACAVDLAGAGVRLALCDRDSDGLAKTAAEIEAAGGEVTTAVLDARDPAGLADFFDQVDTCYGPCLDVAVHVVGGTFRQPFEDSHPQGWEAIMRTNFTWLLHSSQLVIGRMTRGGSIVNLTSIEGHRAAPGFAVYSAMKAAVTGFTRTLAVELAPRSIRVNTVAPDHVPTPSLKAFGERSEATMALGHRIATPMGRAGTYADVGGCVLFLASQLSSFITGSTLHPDGGALASSGWLNWPESGFLNGAPSDILAHLQGDRGEPAGR